MWIVVHGHMLESEPTNQLARFENVGRDAARVLLYSLALLN
jgi:hypothetical protein